MIYTFLQSSLPHLFTTFSQYFWNFRWFIFRDSHHKFIGFVVLLTKFFFFFNKRGENFLTFTVFPITHDPWGTGSHPGAETFTWSSRLSQRCLFGVASSFLHSFLPIHASIPQHITLLQDKAKNVYQTHQRKETSGDLQPSREEGNAVFRNSTLNSCTLSQF